MREINQGQQRSHVSKFIYFVLQIMNQKRYPIPVFIMLLCCTAYAQPGGSSTYDFLNLIPSASTGAMGGVQAAARGNDANLFFQNPSVPDSSMDNQAALSMVRYLASVKYGHAAYVRHCGNAGTYAAGMQFAYYGNFPEASENGELSGNTFSAGDYALYLGWANTLANIPWLRINDRIDTSISVGVSLKTIYSSMAEYYSVGLAGDIAATYQNPSGFRASMLMRNMGKELRPYRSGDREPLPFEIQAGVSQRLKRAPIALYLTARHLEKFDLTYSDPGNVNVDPLTGESSIKTYGFMEKTMRHLVAGMELMPSPNLSLRAGYNYQRRKEMGYRSKMGMAGLSWGIGLKVFRFQLSYAMGIYNAAGTASQFSLSANVSDFCIRKTSK